MQHAAALQVYSVFAERGGETHVSTKTGWRKEDGNVCQIYLIRQNLWRSNSCGLWDLQRIKAIEDTEPQVYILSKMPTVEEITQQ